MRGCWGRVLIETLWNVNLLQSPELQPVLQVLIETLWNVNQKITDEESLKENVLIETLWNVNGSKWGIAQQIIPF